MPDDTGGRGPGRTPSGANAAPARLLLVTRVNAGDEVQVRYWQARFPDDAAAEARSDAVEAFIGSGSYAIAFEIGAADAQGMLARFLNDPRARV